MKLAFFVFVVSIFFPAFVNANVVINEIAWMGTVNSANDEWLELYNNGSSDTDLSGWILKAEDDTPLINLTGVIKANGYFLLERTDDNTIPNVTADLIYVGALENSDEILILKDSSGAEIARVDASGGWPAGDNTTKETMQRVSSGWTTAIGTPGAPNNSGGGASSGAGGEATGDSSASSQTSVSPSGAGSSGSIAPSINPENQLTADGGSDITVIVGAPRKFEGQAFGFKGEPLEGAEFQWSFGDGASAKSRIAYHAYSYPGKYRAVFTVISGRYSASDYIAVTAISPAVSIIEVKSGAGGYIKLWNESPKDIDLSGWIIENTADSFYLPSGTFILAESNIIIPAEISKIIFPQSGTARLLFSNAKAADSYDYPEIFINSQADIIKNNSAKPLQTASGFSDDEKFDASSSAAAAQVKGDRMEENSQSILNNQTALSGISAAETQNSIFSSGWFWFGAAVILGALSAGGVFVCVRSLTY